MTSVLYSPTIVSASALSYESPIPLTNDTVRSRYNTGLAPVYKKSISRILSSQAQRWLRSDRLKAVIGAAPRPELEQSLLRVLISGMVLAYLAWALLPDGPLRYEEKEVLAVTAGFVAFSVLLTVTILAVPRASAARRFLGLAVDNAVTTYCLMRMGERGAFVFFVYLFVTFGAGFRYGRFYLHACQLMSIIGFATVYWLSPFWRQHPSIGVAFFLSLVFLPLYVGVLTERIKSERVKAEEALKDCIERQGRGS